MHSRSIDVHRSRFPAAEAIHALRFGTRLRRTLHCEIVPVRSPIVKAPLLSYGDQVLKTAGWIGSSWYKLSSYVILVEKWQFSSSSISWANRATVMRSKETAVVDLTVLCGMYGFCFCGAERSFTGRDR